MAKAEATAKTEGKEKLPPPVAAVERLVAEIEAEAPPQTAVAKSEPLVPLTAEEVAATDAPDDEQVLPRPRTPEELGARLEKLLDDAKADGLARPLLQEIGAVYAKKGLAIAREGFSLIDDFLEYFLAGGTRKKS